MIDHLSGKIYVYIHINSWLEIASLTKWPIPITKIYQDINSRTQLQQLLEDCQTQAPDYLIVRNIFELGETKEAINHTWSKLTAFGVKVVGFNCKHQSFQLQFLNQDQSKQLLDKPKSQPYQHLRLGHTRNRLAALPPPGKPPYGYRRGKDKYIIDRSTAPVVKDFFERFLLFGSIRGAVRYLETRYGKKISPSTGRNWLTNPVYRGNLCYKNGDIISDTHAAILTRQQAAQIDRLLRLNRRKAPRTASAPRSLAGLVVCSQCQTGLKVTRVTRPHQQGEYLYLSPTACPQQPRCRAIAYQSVLECTIARICQELPQAIAQLETTQTNQTQQQLQAQIQQKRQITAELPTLVQQGILDQQTAQLRAYQLRTEISSLQQQLAQLPPADLKAIAAAVSLPQFWWDLSETERRFYLREFIEKIELVRSDQNWTCQLSFVFNSSNQSHN